MNWVYNSYCLKGTVCAFVSQFLDFLPGQCILSGDSTLVFLKSNSYCWAFKLLPRFVSTMCPPLPAINILCKPLTPYRRLVINAPPGPSISQRGEDDSDEKRDLKRKASRLPHGLWKFLKERKRWTVERQGELPTLNSWVILENWVKLSASPFFSLEQWVPC